MALPIVQTKRTIIIEGMRKALGRVPDADAIIIAENEWFEEIKDDIFQRKDWKLLEETKVVITTAYEQIIAAPSDFSKLIEVTFYDGGQKGTAQDGTLGSITLSASEAITEGSAKGSLVFKTGGTGKAEMSRITSYSESTKIAGVSPDFETVADATTTYMIATVAKDLHFIPNEVFRDVTAIGYPSRITSYGNEFYLDAIPDLSTYAIIFKYLVSIDQVDLDSTKHLRILAKMKNALKAGIYMRTLDSLNDDRASRALKTYESIVLKLMIDDSRSRRQRNNNYFKPVGGMPR